MAGGPGPAAGGLTSGASRHLLRGLGLFGAAPGRPSLDPSDPRPGVRLARGLGGKGLHEG